MVVVCTVDVVPVLMLLERLVKHHVRQRHDVETE